jgi:hypothetical protein
VTFCELRHGPRAFAARADDLATYHGPPVDLTTLRDSEYPVLARALSERWTDRYPSCRAFIAALKGATRTSRPANRIAAAAVSH